MAMLIGKTPMFIGEMQAKLYRSIMARMVKKNMGGPVAGTTTEIQFNAFGFMDLIQRLFDEPFSSQTVADNEDTSVALGLEAHE